MKVTVHILMQEDAEQCGEQQRSEQKHEATNTNKKREGSDVGERRVYIAKQPVIIWMDERRR